MTRRDPRVAPPPTWTVGDRVRGDGGSVGSVADEDVEDGEVAPTRYTRIIEGGSEDMHSAVSRWLRDTQGGDGWLATMARALGEDA